LVKVNKAPSLDKAYEKIETTLQDGTAIKHFVLMLKKQGVKPDQADKLCEKETDVFEILPKSKHNRELKVETTGRFE
jgi:thymidine phosphorylase